MGQVFKINGVDYDCEFKLRNSDNQVINFTKSAVFKMVLLDDFFNPFMRGIVSISNPYDAIENSYLIRGDGRDILNISFKPVADEQDTGFKDNIFEQEFVLFDEDSTSINSDTRSEMLKNFVIISKDAIRFMDLIPYGKIYRGKVGDILKEIFKEVLGDAAVDNNNWASGDFLTEYFPPATFRYMDLINYLLRIYYAKHDDLYVKGFINYDPIVKKYKLQLLSKLFQDNVKNKIEAFIVGDLTTTTGFDNPNNPPAGPPTGKEMGGLRSFAYLTPCYLWTNEYFLNSLVSGYDRLLGQHKMHKIKFDDVRERWNKKFVKPFNASDHVIPFAIKNMSTNKKFRRYTFAYQVEDGVRMVEADMINNLTFYNLQFTFQNIGSPHRRAGKFIDIVSPRPVYDERGNETSFKSEEKVLGTWFLTRVEHIFSGDSYSNTMYATKTYIGPRAKVKLNVE